MGQHRTAGVRRVELVGGVRHEHHREFQSLGAVHRHNGHAARAALAAAALGQAAALLRGIHGPDEGGQSGAARTACPRGKAQQLLPAARPLRHGAHRSQIPGAGKQFLQKLLHRQGASQTAVVRQRLQKRRKAGLPAVEHRAVQTSRRLRGPQMHQIIHRVAEQRAEQHRRQRHILRRVVDDAQQRRKGADVGRVQQIGGHIRVGGDAGSLQRGGVGGKAAPAAQQDAEIPVARRADSAFFPHRKALFHHLPDAGGDGAGLGGSVRAGQEIQLAQTLVFPGQAHHQPLTVPVGHAAQLGRKEGLKEIIDAPDDRRGAAEVGVQRQRGGRARRLGVGPPRLLLGDEHPRLRLTEPVNALLDVPHEKQVVPFWAAESEIDGVLQRVGILIFVHQHGAVTAADGVAQRGAAAVLGLEQLQGQMLIIRVVQQFFLPLGGKKGVRKLLDGAHQRGHQRRGAAAVLPEFLRIADEEIALQRGELFLGPVPQRGGRRGRRVARLAAPDAPGGTPCVRPHQRQRFHSPVPVAALQGLAQKICPVLIVLQNGGVGPVGGIVPSSDAGGGPQKAHRTLCPGERRLQKCLPPAGGGGVGIGLPRFGKFPQRLFRVGQRPGEVIHLQHHAARRVVGAVAVVQVRKGAEIRVGVGGLQRVGQHLLPDALQRSLVGGLKVRRHIQRREMLLHKMQAEGVHRADGGPLQAQLLAAQALVGRIRPDGGGQTLGDIRPQLGRGGVGEGHNEQAVRLHGMVRVGDEARHPLHQHTGLAGAGRRRHQQAAAPGGDGRRLRGGELNAGHGRLLSGSFLKRVFR